MRTVWWGRWILRSRARRMRHPRNGAHVSTGEIGKHTGIRVLGERSVDLAVRIGKTRRARIGGNGTRELLECGTVGRVINVNVTRTFNLESIVSELIEKRESQRCSPCQTPMYGCGAH